MFTFARERQAIATLRPLLKLAPGAVPAVVCLGVITALFEGLGISLFIPLLPWIAFQKILFSRPYQLLGAIARLSSSPTGFRLLDKPITF